MSPSDARWQCNGGDVAGAVERLAAMAAPGALLRVDAERLSLARARREGLDRASEGHLLVRARRVVSPLLPPGAVGRRCAWSSYEWALAGERASLESIGRRIFAALALEDELAAVRWHVVMTAIVAGEAQRTLCCDAGYELREVAERSILAWVTPYDGPDWRESQRYPSVHWLAAEGSDDHDAGAPDETESLRDRVLRRLARLRHHLARFVESGRIVSRNAPTSAQADELSTILLDVVRNARDALRLEMAPTEPPPQRRLFKRAALDGLLDPALAARIEGWLNPRSVLPRREADDPSDRHAELVRRAMDFAILARSLEVGRTLDDDEARAVVERFRADLGMAASPPA